MKRLEALLLSVLLLAGLLALPAQAVETAYPDVAPDAWYAWCVNDATERGLMNGTGSGTFTPDGDLTRAMLVTVLWRLAEEPEAENAATFSDVPDGQWYSDAIAWASGFQVVEGYGDGVFGTNDPVTREQMAVIFFRWAQGQGYDVTFTPNERLIQEESSITHFERIENGEEVRIDMVPTGRPVSGWAEVAVQWAAERDLLTRRATLGQDPRGGDIYRYCVWENATRAEVAVFLSRFCRNCLDEDGTLEPTVPHSVGVITVDLPETWMGSVDARGLCFGDLSNQEPWTGKGYLFQIASYSHMENLPDAEPGKAGRLYTIRQDDMDTDILVFYFGDSLNKDGFFHEDWCQAYDPENPRSYLKLQAQIEQVLRSIRFNEGVEVLYTAPAYQTEQ